VVNINELVDVAGAVQSKRVFWDQEVYEQELERVFGRCWLFLTHESQIPQPGDFVTAYMGEDKVLVVRQRDGSIKAFLNSCTHRGNQVCHADSGNAKAFTCSYHGWSFGMDGSLAALPLEQSAYYNRLDKSQWGLREVAKVDSYRGFVFGCFDPQAPTLADYLGEMGWYLDTWMDSTGGAELVGPPMKSILRCNWKVPAENFIGDGYHVGWTHAAAIKVLGGPLSGLAGNAEIPFDDAGLQVTSRHGHGFGVIWDGVGLIHDDPAYRDYAYANLPAVTEKMGPWRAKLYTGHWNAGIFPTCSYLYGTNTFKVWNPRGPNEIEVWTWTLVEKAMSPELKREVVKQAIHTFGTAGTLESDDGENMETCTWSNRGPQTRKGVMNSQMGQINDAEHPELPGIIGKNFIGETSYRGFYRFWAELMQVDSWEAVRANDATWKDALIKGAAEAKAAERAA
jgi:3-phenylpropionate/trans-cinnamate dioxygenase alpha subunit